MQDTLDPAKVVLTTEAGSVLLTADEALDLMLEIKPVAAAAMQAEVLAEARREHGASG